MRNKLSWFAVPYVVWMALMVVIPILIMVAYAFSTAEFRGTLENFAEMGSYAAVFVRSFRLALVATLICLLIGYPVSYWMAQEGPGFQRTAMALIMLPMWMNFLLRTYSWMSILENNGLLNQFFRAIGLLDLLGVEYIPMIRTSGAVVLGMVYNYLPFMILPIYSVIVKLDHSLLEAARDLGADSAGVFRKVILPLRGDHGVCAGGVHLRHLPPAGRGQPDDAGGPDRAAVFGRSLRPPPGRGHLHGYDAHCGGVYGGDESLRRG